VWALEPQEQLQQQIPYGDDKQEKQKAKATATHPFR
jgi:hypothetical protein